MLGHGRVRSSCCVCEAILLLRSTSPDRFATRPPKHPWGRPGQVEPVTGERGKAVLPGDDFHSCCSTPRGVTACTATTHREPPPQPPLHRQRPPWLGAEGLQTRLRAAAGTRSPEAQLRREASSAAACGTERQRPPQRSSRWACAPRGEALHAGRPGRRSEP